jgi:hypothetical protein
MASARQPEQGEKQMADSKAVEDADKTLRQNDGHIRFATGVDKEQKPDEEKDQRTNRSQLKYGRSK